jgi:hypothetical protein
MRRNVITASAFEGRLRMARQGSTRPQRSWLRVVVGHARFEFARRPNNLRVSALLAALLLGRMREWAPERARAMGKRA